MQFNLFFFFVNSECGSRRVQRFRGTLRAAPQVPEGGGTGPGCPAALGPAGNAPWGGGHWAGSVPVLRRSEPGAGGTVCGSPQEPASWEPTTVSARGGARGAQLGAQGAPAARSRGEWGSGGGAAGWGRCGAAPSGRAPCNLQTDLGSYWCRAPPPLAPRCPGGAGGKRPRSGCAGDGDSTVPLDPTGTCPRVSPEACHLSCSRGGSARLVPSEGRAGPACGRGNLALGL